MVHEDKFIWHKFTRSRILRNRRCSHSHNKLAIIPFHSWKSSWQLTTVFQSVFTINALFNRILLNESLVGGQTTLTRSLPGWFVSQSHQTNLHFLAWLQHFQFWLPTLFIVPQHASDMIRPFALLRRYLILDCLYARGICGNDGWPN